MAPSKRRTAAKEDEAAAAAEAAEEEGVEGWWERGIGSQGGHAWMLLSLLAQLLCVCGLL